MQELLLHVWKARERFFGRSSFDTFAGVVLQNRYRDLLRVRRSQAAVVCLGDRPAVIVNQVDRIHRRMDIMASLNQLPRGERMVVLCDLIGARGYTGLSNPST